MYGIYAGKVRQHLSRCRQNPGVASPHGPADRSVSAPVVLLRLEAIKESFCIRRRNNFLKFGRQASIPTHGSTTLMKKWVHSRKTKKGYPNHTQCFSTGAKQINANSPTLHATIHNNTKYPTDFKCQRHSNAACGWTRCLCSNPSIQPSFLRLPLQDALLPAPNPNIPPISMANNMQLLHT